MIQSYLILTRSICFDFIIKSKSEVGDRIEGDQKPPFVIAATPMSKGGRYSFPWIAPLYPWYIPYIAEC